MPKRKRAVKKKISNREAERRIAAIRAICNAEIETLLMRLRLARSFLTKEHLESPALEFFKKNLPDISVIQNEHSGEIEFDWNNVCNLHLFTAMVKEPRASFLPDMSHLDFSSRSVETAFLQAAKSHIPDLVWEEMSETHLLGLPDGFQTPGAAKAWRNAPLCSWFASGGVYKEDNNMETIQESGEG
ncbi:hypothetical protein H6P81_020702 [Aristolochia fimbriata]|uniref:Uncharacterized protein n=1 Tax=Aristolochia fimbriata TaxID=158543 RepID=A0AAV7DYC8_ARIFI|nr:hypothetical protein H6P81_020702 [Aristolochia fimbriata]